MADRILKDPTGNIWKNTDGKILKDRPFSETTTVDGKISEYVAGDFENVDGYASIWYDSFGSNNLIQNTVSARLFIEDYNDLQLLRATDSFSISKNAFMDFTSTFNYKTVIAVYHKTTGNHYFSSDNGAGSFDGTLRASIYKSNAIINGTQGSNVYVNGVLNNSYVPPDGDMKVIAFSIGANTFNAITINHNSGYYGVNGGYIHLVYYDRLLNENEIIYNSNALMTKYNLT